MAKILVVEDDQNLSALIRNLLNVERHVVEVANNGDDAIGMLKVLVRPGRVGLDASR